MSEWLDFPENFVTYKISLNKVSLHKLLEPLISFFRYADGNKDHLKDENDKAERNSMSPR
jgi:hypothetical protein